MVRWSDQYACVSNVFAPVPRAKSAVDLCADQIRRAILDGAFAPGDRLPGERVLAERFDVNRVTVRSALGRLSAEGLVEGRHGLGHVVRDYRRHGGPRLLPALYETAQGSERVAIVRDLLEVRRALVAPLLLRAFAGGDAARDRVHAAVERLAAAVEQGAPSEALAARDLDVLGALLEATESAVWPLVANPVSEVLQAFPDLRAALYAAPAENVARYRALLAAWEAGADPAALAETTRRALEARDLDTLARFEAP